MPSAVAGACARLRQGLSAALGHSGRRVSLSSVATRLATKRRGPAPSGTAAKGSDEVCRHAAPRPRGATRPVATRHRGQAAPLPSRDEAWRHAVPRPRGARRAVAMRHRGQAATSVVAMRHRGQAAPLPSRDEAWRHAVPRPRGARRAVAMRHRGQAATRPVATGRGGQRRRSQEVARPSGRRGVGGHRRETHWRKNITAEWRSVPVSNSIDFERIPSGRCSGNVVG